MNNVKLIKANKTFNHMNDEDYLKKISKIRFSKKELPLVTEYGTMKRYLFIVIENLQTGIYKPTAYSKYFFQGGDTGLLNKEINTKENHAHIIVNFLNYIFISKYDKFKIKTIKEINISMGNEFLRDYINGKVAKGGTKSENVAKDAENKLTAFYRFLYENIKLNNIQESDFKIKSHKNVFRNGKSKKISKRYESLFTIAYPEYEKVDKVKRISNYVLGQFLKVADEYYPEITLGLALQSFGGLRAGEVCCIATYMINSHISRDGIGWFEVNLKKERQLREDRKKTGQIKKHRVQPIHPIFMPLIDTIYQKHMNYISKYKNPYQPLFLNERGLAMTNRSYHGKFQKIKEIVIERLASHPNIYVRSEANILSSGKLGSHVLRYYFTQFVSSLSTTYSATELAYWRGDSTLEAAIGYLASSPIISEKLKLVQNETIESIMGG